MPDTKQNETIVKETAVKEVDSKAVVSTKKPARRGGASAIHFKSGQGKMYVKSTFNTKAPNVLLLSPPPPLSKKAPAKPNPSVLPPLTFSSKAPAPAKMPLFAFSKLPELTLIYWPTPHRSLTMAAAPRKPEESNHVIPDLIGNL